MSASMANGDELLRFIESLGELEWARFESRCFSIQIKANLVTEDRSSRPPYTSFRFSNEKQEVIVKLASAVESYAGSVEWVMIAHDRQSLPGRNWVICPRKVHDAKSLAFNKGQPVWRYFKENYPDFGPKAYVDLLGLVNHVKNIFENA